MKGNIQGLTLIAMILIAVGVISTSPDIVPVRSQTYYTCPAYLLNGDEFILTFSNSGGTGNLAVGLQSEDVEFEVDMDALRAKGSGKTTRFVLKLDKNSIPNNKDDIIISYTWGYKRYMFLQILCTTECHYTTSGSPSGFKFVTEEDLGCLQSL